MKIKTFALVLIFATIVAGCATVEPEIRYVDRPVEVKVLVPAKIPEPPVINRPFLPIQLLVPENITDPEKIAEFYVKSIILLESYANTLQCTLDTYRTDSPPQCKIVPED